MTRLITITGPIAAGKNALADLLAERLVDAGRTVVVLDVDDVAAMVRGAGAGATGLWPAAHVAHGALVGGWLRSTIGVVVAVGPFCTEQERADLASSTPADVVPLQVLVDAPVEVTWARAAADPTRGLSREHGFHHRAHARFRAHEPDLPRDLTLDTSRVSLAESVEEVLRALAEREAR